MNKAMSSSKIAIVLLLVLYVTLLVVVESDARKNRRRRGQNTGMRSADKMMHGKNRRNAQGAMARMYSNKTRGRCTGKMISVCAKLAMKCRTNTITKRSIPSDEETTPHNSGKKRRRKRTRRRRCGRWRVRRGRRCVKVTCGSCFSRCWKLS